MNGHLQNWLFVLIRFNSHQFRGNTLARRLNVLNSMVRRNLQRIEIESNEMFSICCDVPTMKNNRINVGIRCCVALQESVIATGRCKTNEFQANQDGERKKRQAISRNGLAWACMGLHGFNKVWEYNLFDTCLPDPIIRSDHASEVKTILNENDDNDFRNSV